jgi:hypothetical protein
MFGVIVVWTLLLAIAVVRFRDPRWMFAWIWVMVTPLPIVFLPMRGGPLLYLVLPGWSLAAALLCRGLLSRLVWVWKTLGIPRQAAMAAGLFACAAVYARETWIADQYARFGYHENGKFTLGIIDQLKALQIHPKPGSRVLFLTDPFPGFYDMQIIAELLWNDHSLQVSLQQFGHYPAEHVDQMDYLLDYDQGRLRVLKSPPDSPAGRSPSLNSPPSNSR